jgi:hypothetical protein
MPASVSVPLARNSGTVSSDCVSLFSFCSLAHCGGRFVIGFDDRFVLIKSVFVVGGIFVACTALVMSGVVGAVPMLLSFLLHPVAARAHPKIPAAKKIFFMISLI